MANETIAARVIRKFRDEMARQHLSQRDVANLLGWSQSSIAKILTQRVELTVEDMGAIAFALSLNLCELIRQEGYEYVADLTPTELRILESYRQRAQPVQEAIAILLDVRAPKARAKKT